MVTLWQDAKIWRERYIGLLSLGPLLLLGRGSRDSVTQELEILSHIEADRDLGIIFFEILHQNEN